MKNLNRVRFVTAGVLLSFAHCVFSQDVKNDGKFADITGLRAEALLRTQRLWPGEEIFGTVIVTNDSDSAKQIPDLDDELDGRFQVQELTGPEAIFRIPSSTKLLRPEFRRKEARASRFLSRRQSSTFAFTKADHRIMAAPVWEGEFLLRHSFLGALAKFDVSSPSIMSISESEWSDMDLRKDGLLLEKRYLRVFSLEDQNRSAVCYTTRGTRSLQQDDFPALPPAGLKVTRSTAHLLAPYNCSTVPFRSIIRLHASVDRDGKIVAILYPSSESPRRIIFER